MLRASHPSLFLFPLSLVCAVACGGDEAAAGGSSDGGVHGGGTDGGAKSDGGGGGPADGGMTTDANVPKGPLVAYVSGYGPNIGWYAADESSAGVLSSTGSIKSIGSSPSFLAWNPAHSNLYAVEEAAAGRVAAYAIDPKTGALTYLNDVSSKGNGPAHVSVDATGKWVFVANYGDGTVAVLPTNAGGSLGDAVDTKAPGANAHMIIADPSNRFVFVPCKGKDYVAQYLFDAAKGTLTPNATPTVATAAGAGPRHLAFHPNGKWAYLITENASTVTTLSLDTTTGRLSAVDTISTLPAAFSGSSTGAEISVHPTGNWVYASNRGHGSIAEYKVDPTSGKLAMLGQILLTEGKTPRHFSLTPEGRWLYLALQDTGIVGIVSVELGAGGSGLLASTGRPSLMNVQAPSFVGLLRLPAP
jgi:6-phosphogluconolactonase